MWERFGARLIDAMISFGITFAVVLASAGLNDGAGSTGIVLIALLFGVFYEIGFVAVLGATPGKMIVGLKVIGPHGKEPPGWGPAALRWLPALAGLVPFFGLLISIALGIASGVRIHDDAENRSIQDRLGNTRVVKR